jgi:hypothetical protein
MKTRFNLISKQSKAALLLGALTITAAIGLTESAQAAPRRNGPALGRRNDRRNDRRRGATYTFVGRVIRDRGGNVFDMSDNGKTYNVYAINRTPRRLSKGDIVRVTGRRYGENDIREARLRIVDNN